MTPFSRAAAYYAPFRPPYAPAALDWIAEALALDRSARVLDLGCGPGALAIPFSRIAAEVVAVDPEPEMLAEGRRLAAERGGGAIRWIEGRAEDILAREGSFQAVVMGQSFHWMDRDRVLALLADRIAPGGGLAILDEGERRPQESWERAAGDVVFQFLGRTGRHPGKHPETAHAPSLLRSRRFQTFTVREFPHELTRDIPSVIGCVYSGINVSRAVLGEQADAFEAALTARLLDLNPTGVFRERLETAVIIAHRAPTETAP